MEGKEQHDLLCNYECRSEVSAFPFSFSQKALKVEPVEVCVLSNDKSDLSYQTDTPGV